MSSTSILETWNSSHTDVAVISSSGLLSPLSNGTVIITATWGGFQADALVTIHEVARFFVEPSAPYLIIGSELSFKAIFELSNGTIMDVASVWTSSDTNLANITSAGDSVAKSAGLVHITALRGNYSTIVQVNILELCHNFAFGTDSNLVIPSDTPQNAVLTGTGTKLGVSSFDQPGSGWLQLTRQEVSNGFGYGYLNVTFTLAAPLQIELDFASYRACSDYAQNGISLYLFDADVTFARGQATNRQMLYNREGANPGMAGAYMGLALMEESNAGQFCDNPGAWDAGDYLCIRGPVVGFGNGSVGNRTSSDSYSLKPEWVSTQKRRFTINGKSDSQPRLTCSPPWYEWTENFGYRLRAPASPGEEGYRHLIVRISEAPTPKVSVWMLYANETTPVLYLDNVDFAPISPNQRLRLGFAGSGSGQAEFHEVKNVVIRPVVNGQAGNACVPNLVSFILSTDNSDIGIIAEEVPEDRQITIESPVWSDGITRTLTVADISFWTSSNTNVGTIDSAGIFKPSLTGGTSVVSATIALQDTKGDSYTVTANITLYVAPCATLLTVPSEPYFVLGARRQMTLACNTTLGRIVPLPRCGTSWSSADSKVNITSTGLLQTVAAGNTTVLVVYGGLTATSIVRIVEINRPLTNATDPSLTYGGVNPSRVARLTGTGTEMDGLTDQPGQGWLRLTNVDMSQGGYVYLDDVFTMTTAIEFSFEFAIWKWGTYLGDGISAFFFDADVAFARGEYGRGLLYTPNYPDYPEGATLGIAGGYAAVFIDGLGNPCSGSDEAVCLKGPVAGFGNGAIGNRTNVRQGYQRLAYRGKIKRFTIRNETDSVPPLLGDGRKVRPPGSFVTRTVGDRMRCPEGFPFSQ